MNINNFPFGEVWDSLESWLLRRRVKAEIRHQLDLLISVVVDAKTPDAIFIPRIISRLSALATTSDAQSDIFIQEFSKTPEHKYRAFQSLLATSIVDDSCTPRIESTWQSGNLLQLVAKKGDIMGDGTLKRALTDYRDSPSGVYIVVNTLGTTVDDNLDGPDILCRYVAEMLRRAADGTYSWMRPARLAWFLLDPSQEPTMQHLSSNNALTEFAAAQLDDSTTPEPLKSRARSFLHWAQELGQLISFAVNRILTTRPLI